MNYTERKEIERCRDLAETIWQSDGGEDVSSEIADLKDALAHLLSTPPRNCDVGTPDEQAKWFYKFCQSRTSVIKGMCDPTCPCIGCVDLCHCFARWMAMPYTKGEADGK